MNDPVVRPASVPAAVVPVSTSVPAPTLVPLRTAASSFQAWLASVGSTASAAALRIAGTVQSLPSLVTPPAPTPAPQPAPDPAPSLIDSAAEAAAVAFEAAQKAAAAAAEAAAEAAAQAEALARQAAESIEETATAVVDTLVNAVTPTGETPLTPADAPFAVKAPTESSTPLMDALAPTVGADPGAVASQDISMNAALQTAVAAAFIATGSVDARAAEGTGRIFYVDFAAGNNGNSGTSPSAPWKHAPGDALATGGPATVRLAGGDTVRFKGGVSYRGTIELNASGAPGNPIFYSGLGYGTGNAILDGADPVTSNVPCPSQSACGGAANWTSLRLVTFTDPETTYKKIYDTLGPLTEAVVPSLADPFHGDDKDSYAVIPMSQAPGIAAGRIDSALLADAARGQTGARIALWVSPNVITERNVISVSGNTVFFDITKAVKPYTTRDTRAAIFGTTKGLTRPGFYAVIAPGKAVVYPRSSAGSQLHVGNGRRMMDLNGQAHIVVRGFHMLRGTASATSTRQGLSVANIGDDTNDVVIENNQFGPSSLRNGYGAISLGGVTNLTVRNNRFVDLQWGSGARFGSTASNILVEGNRLERGGRTGLYFQGSKNVTVRGNILSGWNGVHGNGMSAYLGNQVVSFVGNCVFGSARPLTFHGDGNGTINDIKVLGNIFVADADASAGIHSWGKLTRKVTIQQNLLIGPKQGVILDNEDDAVTVTNNRTTGVLTAGGADPANWIVKSNDETLDYNAARAATTLTPTRCQGTGYGGAVITVDAGAAG